MAIWCFYLLAFGLLESSEWGRSSLRWDLCCPRQQELDWISLCSYERRSTSSSLLTQIHHGVKAVLPSPTRQLVALFTLFPLLNTDTHTHIQASACPPLPPWKPKVQRDGLRLHALAWPSNLFCIFPVLLLQDCFSSLPPPFSALYLHLTSSSPKYLPCVLSLPGADAAQMIDPLPLAIWLWLHKTANKVETAGQLIMEISLKLYSFMV